MIAYSFARGATIALAIEIMEGEAGSVGMVVAQLRALPVGENTLSATAPLAASFTVTARSATAEVGAGWTLTIPAATSATLPAGRYIADALKVIGGEVYAEPSVLIIITEPATRLA